MTATSRCFLKHVDLAHVTRCSVSLQPARSLPEHELIAVSFDAMARRPTVQSIPSLQKSVRCPAMTQVQPWASRLSQLAVATIWTDGNYGLNLLALGTSCAGFFDIDTAVSRVFSISC